jgi:hypothetical protein
MDEVRKTLIMQKEGMIVTQKQEILAWNEAQQWCETTST